MLGVPTPYPCTPPLRGIKPFTYMSHERAKYWVFFSRCENKYFLKPTQDFAPSRLI
jgi:hypothetical protein